MKTLIILHGWQSSKEKWQKVKAIIENSGIRVICPDIPGFKHETELKEPWNLDNFINWFKDFVFSQELENPEIKDGFYLLGHSFGGRMTIKIASQNLFKLNGIILVAAAGVKRNSTFYKETFGLGAKLIKAFRLGDHALTKNVYNFLRIFFYHYIIRKTDYLNATGAMSETIRNILTEDLKDKLDKIIVPTKIIWGDKDNYTSVNDAYFINEKIKNSELEVYKKIGHMPYLECPEKLAESIIEFINKT
jgi:pimeloyl-ACP methyl ester carboxylesterase